MVKLIQQFPPGIAHDVATKNILRNSYWAHSECILVAMLSDEDRTIRNTAVNKILTIRGDLNICDTDNDKFTGGDLEIEDEVDNDNENGVYRPQDSSVRPFKVPIVNPKRKSYHKMINLSSSITEPLIITGLSRDQLEEIVKSC